MTSSLCLMLCLLWFVQADPNATKIAHGPVTPPDSRTDITPPKVDPPKVDLNAKLGGASRSLNEPEKFALLVGINKYEKLSPGEHLNGCHNDVHEIQSVMTERFGFDSKNVTTLLDSQATAEGIRKEMASLTKQVQSRPDGVKPAQVVFYFSGHGSRIPDQPEGHPDCDSEDGFDSTLVVYDSGKQGSDTDIRDDELNKFSHDICDGGKAELLLVLDSCHSGGGARGGITKFRGLSRSLEPNVVVNPENRKIARKTLPEGTVFFSACQANQLEPEYEIDGKQYGLFTYHLTKLLKTEQVVSSLDYMTLKDMIHRSYLRNQTLAAPTPTVEGALTDLRKPILGANRSIDRKPYWEVKKAGKERDTVRMEAGKINGITGQSLFEMYESPEQTLNPGAKSLGWFRIENVEGNHALGTFFRWKDENQTEQLDAVLPNDFKGGFAVERYHDYGDNILTVRLLDTVSGETIPPGDTSIPESIRNVLLGPESENESKWIRWSGPHEPCHVVVKYDGTAKLASVFPATGCADDDTERQKTWGAVVPESLRGGWGPVPWESESGKTDLTRILRSVMRVATLKRLVAEKATSVDSKNQKLPTPHSPLSTALEVNVLRYDLDTRETQAVRTNPENKGIVLEGGEDDWYQIRVRNNDTKNVYVTILCIDPNMKIEPFAFGPQDNATQYDPTVGTGNNPDANKLAPDGEFVSLFGFAEPFGPHTIIVFATREQSDFSYLAQAGETKARNMKGTPSRTLQFIEDQCTIGTRSTKRPPVPRDDTWHLGAIDVISEAR